MLKVRALACLLLCGAAIPAIACAQSAQPATTLGEIIVTAQKRSEKITDVPLSITAQTGQQLAKQGVHGTADLERVVPGFTYQPSSRAAPVFTIRGIGFYDTSIANAPAVTVYLDQVPLAFSAMTPGVGLDLERVEAMKGPQGTLFGQNATGGAINYIAAKPTPNFAAGAQATYGSFNENDFEGYLSGPVSDTLELRLAGRTEHRDDWQHSYTRNASLGQRDFDTGRFIADWRPTSGVRLEFNLNGWQDKSDTQAWQYLAFTPTNPNGRPDALVALPTYPLAPRNIQSADWDAGNPLKRDDHMYQASVRGDIDVAQAGTLTFITAYTDYSADIPTDGDGTSFEDFYLTTLGYLRSYFQEVRFSGDAGPLKYVAGANVQLDRTLDNEVADSLGTNQSAVGLPFFGFSQHERQNAKTWGPFANLEYRLTSQLSVQGAIRYTTQDRDAHGCLSDINGSLAATFSRLSTILSHSPTVIPVGACVTLGSNFKPVNDVDGKLDENNVSWKLGLNWKPQRDTLIYANATRGYKSGGFDTLPAIRDTQLAPLKQEAVLAYEVGAKTTFADHRATLSGAAFYYDYSDKQLTGFINVGAPFGTLPGLVSIPRSYVSGAEASLTATPVHDLKLSLGATYVYSKVDKDFNTYGPYGVLTDIRGEAFPNTPRWQLIGDAEYGHTLTGGERVFAGGGFRYRSASYSAFGDSPLFRLGGYALLDLRTGVESADGKLSATVWGHNVTDRRYLTTITRPIDTTVALTGMPATFGVTLAYRH